MKSNVRNKVLAVFAAVHLGLVLSVFAAARLGAGREIDAAFVTLLVGIGLTYLGCVVGTFYVVWPLLPWFSRLQRSKTLAQEILHNLPQLIDTAGKTIESLKPLLRTLSSSESPAPAATKNEFAQRKSA